MKCSSTSEFTVPLVVSGRSFVPVEMGAQELVLEVAARVDGEDLVQLIAASVPSRPRPNTSVRTPRWVVAISGPIRSGMPGVVCRAMAVQTVSAAAVEKPRSRRNLARVVGAVELEALLDLGEGVGRPVSWNMAAR